MGFGPEVAFNQLPASHLKSGLTQVVALKRLRKMGHGGVKNISRKISISCKDMCLLKFYGSLTHPCPAAPPRGCYSRLVAFPRDLAWAPLAAAAAAAPVAAGAAVPSVDGAASTPATRPSPDHHAPCCALDGPPRV